jgi:hypothetical protein
MDEFMCRMCTKSNAFGGCSHGLSASSTINLTLGGIHYCSQINAIHVNLYMRLEKDRGLQQPSKPRSRTRERKVVLTVGCIGLRSIPKTCALGYSSPAVIV